MKLLVCEMIEQIKNVCKQIKINKSLAAKAKAC